MPDISTAQHARTRANNGIRNQTNTGINYMLTKVQTAADQGLFTENVMCNYAVPVRRAIIAGMRERGFIVTEYDRDDSGNSIRLEWSEPDPVPAPVSAPEPVRAPIVAMSKPATPREFPEKPEEPEPPQDQSRWTQI